MKILFRVRKLLARHLARAALRLDPNSYDVTSFYVKQMFDTAVYSRAIMHIDSARTALKLGDNEENL